MPGAKGRPANRTFMKLGKVKVTRPDSLNWTVETPEKTTYHTNLPYAIRRAAEAAAESRSTDAQEWLVEYAKIEGRMVAAIGRALKGWEG